MDETGRIISYEEYYPYGSTSYQAMDAGLRTSAKRYRYTGKEKDEETGLAYHGARYYACWLGRWCAVDPESRNQPYSYCLNSPTGLVDPDGRIPTFPDPTQSMIGLWVGEKLENLQRNLGTVAQFGSDMSLIPSVLEMTVGSPLDLVPSQAFQEGRPLGRDISTVVGVIEAGVGATIFAAGAAIEAGSAGGGATIGAVGGPPGSAGGALLGGALALPAAGTLMALGGGMTLHGGAVAGANFMNGPDPTGGYTDAAPHLSTGGIARRGGGGPESVIKREEELAAMTRARSSGPDAVAAELRQVQESMEWSVHPIEGGNPYVNRGAKVDEPWELENYVDLKIGVRGTAEWLELMEVGDTVNGWKIMKQKQEGVTFLRKGDELIDYAPRGHSSLNEKPHVAIKKEGVSTQDGSVRLYNVEKIHLR
ncbi:MAG TPA: RHS repeat-associated core domain-containing protein [Blastocatellia bacterium]